MHNYDSDNILLCPSVPYTSKDGITYRLSGIWYGTTPEPPLPPCLGPNNGMTGINDHNPERITHADMTFALMEGSYNTSWENGWDGNYAKQWDTEQIRVNTRHGGTNVVFVDGHVEFLNHDYRPEFVGRQTMPRYDQSDCPDYFYGFSNTTVYRARW